jgi:hypothetical protein
MATTRGPSLERLQEIARAMKGKAQAIKLEMTFAGRQYPRAVFVLNTETAAKDIAALADELDRIAGASLPPGSGT